MSPIQTTRMTNYRWIICGMLFFATMINYLDRQVLSLTWKDFIAPEFAWTDDDYGKITAFFSLAYAFSMLFAGVIVDYIGVKKGYVWAMCIWSFGAILHGCCSVLATGYITGEWTTNFGEAKEILHNCGVAGLLMSNVTVVLFIICRLILSIGQSANFPAAVSVTTDYFPKKDRAFAISVFNIGASVGALFAPVTIPLIARHFGWEMAFVVFGAIGYIWVLLWIRIYMKPQNNDFVNMSELNYIQQDEDSVEEVSEFSRTTTKRIGLLRCFTFRQTWALIIGRFMTDGAWWFILFWIPVYISEFYNYTSDSPMGMAMIFVIYLITLLSIAGGYLPSRFVNRYGLSPYQSRMRSMLIFAAVQLIGFLAVPSGMLSPWFLVIIIGIQGASHQSWSANLYAMVGDFFPKHAVATVTGIAGMAGGLSSYIVMESSAELLMYADGQDEAFSLLGYEGKQAAYMIIFCSLAVFYLIGWAIVKSLVPDGSAIDKRHFER